MLTSTFAEVAQVEQPVAQPQCRKAVVRVVVGDPREQYRGGVPVVGLPLLAELLVDLNGALGVRDIAGAEPVAHVKGFELLDGVGAF